VAAQESNAIILYHLFSPSNGMFLGLFGSPVTSSITSASSSIQQSSTVSSAISQPTVSALIPSSTAVNHASSHSNAGAIAGGVVGGLVLFAVVALVALWWFIRRRNPRAHDNRAFVTPLTNMVSSTGLPDGPSLLSTNPYVSEVYLRLGYG
jgi:hypothetical protein